MLSVSRKKYLLPLILRQVSEIFPVSYCRKSWRGTGAEFDHSSVPPPPPPTTTTPLLLMCRTLRKPCSRQSPPAQLAVCCWSDSSVGGSCPTPARTRRSGYRSLVCSRPSFGRSWRNRRVFSERQSSPLLPWIGRRKRQSPAGHPASGRMLLFSATCTCSPGFCWAVHNNLLRQNCWVMIGAGRCLGNTVGGHLNQVCGQSNAWVQEGDNFETMTRFRFLFTALPSQLMPVNPLAPSTARET